MTPKRILPRVWPPVLACIIAGHALAAQVPAKGEAWVGSLIARGRTITLVLRVDVVDAHPTARVDIPSAYLAGLPTEHLSVTRDSLSFDFITDHASFRGERSAGGDTITGVWLQAGQSAPLLFVRTMNPPAVARRNQTPVPPFPYATEEVRYRGTDGVALTGTLSFPHGKGPWPAVLLLTVAGPDDRDETHGGHRPYAVLADFLTRRGIAVLRVDDRGVGGSGGSGGSYFQTTVSQLADDALAGVAFLAGRTGIDSTHVGIIGNSEGTIVAAIAATRSLRVSFVVMLAGLGLRGDEAIRVQGRLYAEAAHMSAAQASAFAAREDSLLDIVRNESDSARGVSRIGALLAAPDAMRVYRAYAFQPATKDALAEWFMGPWYRSEIAIEPVPVLHAVRVPVLAITGSLDRVLPAAEHLIAIERALHEGGNSDVTTREVPGVNHLMQTAKTGSVVEYDSLDESFSPVVLEAVYEWLRSRIKSGR